MKYGACLVLSNQVVNEGAVLLRNVILARWLGPDQMGLAVMLAIVLRCLEMVSYLAADRLLVQARDGGTNLFQANAHGLEALRGLLAGFVLAAVAQPAAFAFGYPEMAWAFMGLGLVPMIKGFVHLDFRRLQRKLRFGPTFRVESGSSLLAMLGVWPAVALAGDFSALLWVSLAHAVAYVLISHLIARRPYRIRFDPDYLRRMLSFGWPMLLNGLVMFGVFQGDRLIVALSVSPADLGRYALALQLGLLPTLVFARGSLSLLLPVLARVQEQKPEFSHIYHRSVALLAIVSVAFMACYILGGNYVIGLLFGSGFAVSPALLAVLGCALAVRILRIAPSTAMLALGDSRALMLANLWRVGGLGLAALAAVLRFDLVYIAAAAAVGEAAALLAAVILLNRQHRLKSLWRVFVPGLLALVALLVWAGRDHDLAANSIIASTTVLIMLAWTHWRRSGSVGPPLGASQ